MRILVIEDDVKTGEMIRDMVRSSGYVCDVAHTGQEGLDIIKSSAGSYEYDAIILDRRLTDMDGLDDFLPRLRCRKSKVPVIFLSALSGVDHKIKAFEFGADDYLVKPPHKLELMSRIKSVIRRTCGHISSVFKIGNLRLDFHKQVCTIGDSNEPIPLTNKEYGMLELLCLYGPGAIVSKEKFINHLYSNCEPELKIIDVFMCKLRHKIAYWNSGICYIETVWGRGYTLNENAPVSHPALKPGAKGSKLVREAAKLSGAIDDTLEDDTDDDSDEAMEAVDTRASKGRRPRPEKRKEKASAN